MLTGEDEDGQHLATDWFNTVFIFLTKFDPPLVPLCVIVLAECKISNALIVLYVELESLSLEDASFIKDPMCFNLLAVYTSVLSIVYDYVCAFNQNNVN